MPRGVSVPGGSSKTTQLIDTRLSCPSTSTLPRPRRHTGGCHYACRFGPTFGEEEGSGEGSGADAETVEASFDHRQGSVRCRAPDRAAGSVAPILLSLNGQQFSKVGENFTWVSPSPPPPPPPEWYDFPVEG